MSQSLLDPSLSALNLPDEIARALVEISTLRGMSEKALVEEIAQIEQGDTLAEKAALYALNFFRDSVVNKDSEKDMFCSIECACKNLEPKIPLTGFAEEAPAAYGTSEQQTSPSLEAALAAVRALKG